MPNPTLVNTKLELYGGKLLRIFFGDRISAMNHITTVDEDCP
jgi:hypothetical protein